MDRRREEIDLGRKQGRGGVQEEKPASFTPNYPPDVHVCDGAGEFMEIGDQIALRYKKSPSPLVSGLGDGERGERSDCEERKERDGVLEEKLASFTPNYPRRVRVCGGVGEFPDNCRSMPEKGKKPPSPLESRLGGGERGESVREEGVGKALIYCLPTYSTTSQIRFSVS